MNTTGNMTGWWSTRAHVVAMALTVLLGITSLDGAQAQQSGQALQGGGQGAGSGGSTGGVVSPSGSGSAGATAGASSGPGSPSGTSRGPGPTNQNRFGGEEPAPVPPPPPGTTPVPPTAETPAAASTLSSYLGDAGRPGEGYVLGRGGRCEDYELGRMTVEQRIAGANLERLNAAEAYLAPGFSADTPKTPIYILANYQQELEQVEPSMALAGTYLGLVATRRVTPDVVVKVNNLLCLATAPPQAEAISQTAETQRLVVR